MTNRDIIIDTNAFVNFFVDSQRIEKIIEECDNIFIARCSWEDEFRPLYHLYIATLGSIETFIKTFKHPLEKRNKFKVELPKARFGKKYEELEKKLKEHKANNCDLEICRLAYERARKSRRVAIMTKDRAIHKAIPTFSHQLRLRNIEIEVICPEDYDP